MMNNNWKKLIIIAALLICLLIQGALAKDIYIAINGDDSNPGTKAKPLASLQAAQRAVRNSIKAGLKEPVNVVIGGGTYYLASPLSLRPEDSGTANCPITWRAAKDEKVILSGGVPIEGVWKKSDKKGIWCVDVPGVKDGLNFHQLFVEGKRAVRARYPNKSEKNPFLYATGGGMEHAEIDPKIIKTSWAGLDTQINVVTEWKFFNQWNTVTAVDTKTGRIDIADSERHGKIIKGNWFWIEGVKEELDEPGEWYLDRNTGRLYYMPKPGVNPNTLKIVASRLNVIVYAKGDVEKKTHVEYVNFKGLQFRHTTFTLGQIEARVHTDAAIRLDNAANCRIENCHFENIGGYALWLHLDSQRNVFGRNTVLNSGGGGVLLTGSRLSYMDDSKVYTPGKVAATVAPILNRIIHNTVKHCGKIRYYGGGVHLDSRPACMAMAPGNYIAHNYFSDLSRNGVFAFRNQGGNIVEYNHIHDAMQTTVDGACIHFATMNHLNAPNYILNNWLYDIWGYEQKPDGKPMRHLANGVFLDWDSSNTTVKDNYVYNAGGTPIKVIWHNWKVINSGNKSSNTRIVPPFVDEVGPKGTATNGIDLETNCLIGSVIHYSDSKLVAITGDWVKQSISGMRGLFKFNLLKVERDKKAEISYSLPITEDGTYQISLLYKPNKQNASNAKIDIHHAGGIDQVRWNMTKGSGHGFAVEVGTYPFKAGKDAKVVISNEEANGIVVADSVAFVKVSDELYTDHKVLPKSRLIMNLESGQKQVVVTYGTSLTKIGAWVDQVGNILKTNYPGLVTIHNNAGSGKASDWGVENLQENVLDIKPNTIFMEFAINDCVDRFGISVEKARENLENMIDRILQKNPKCEIILMTMNPAVGKWAEYRKRLPHYYQMYRDVAKKRKFLLIDHYPHWKKILDTDPDLFLRYVADGIHPEAKAYKVVATPQILKSLGLDVKAKKKSLIGILVDEKFVQTRGNWLIGELDPILGDTYVHDGNQDKGTKSIIFDTEVTRPGNYIVKLLYTAHANRATNTPVVVSVDGRHKTFKINQKKSDGEGFVLGTFEIKKFVTVVVSNKSTDGYVIVDGLQMLAD